MKFIDFFLLAMIALTLMMCGMRMVHAQSETVTVTLHTHSNAEEFCLSPGEFEDVGIGSLFWDVRRCCMFIEDDRPLPPSCLADDIMERLRCCPAYSEIR